VKPRYKRALLKIGGEAFSGEDAVIDRDSLQFIAEEVRQGLKTGTDIALVVGGGNIVRGSEISPLGIDRVTADQMGMLGTAINALAFEGYLREKGVSARVMSAVQMGPISEPYVKERALRHLTEGQLLLFSCGTGNPYFTTDTAASLRAAEIDADILLKGTKVDGVYDEDPLVNPGAKRYERIGYLDYLSKNLKVMDATAISFCMDRSLPVVVFNIYERGTLKRVLLGEEAGTLIG
jgi:uridylate kinase